MRESVSIKQQQKQTPNKTNKKTDIDQGRTIKDVLLLPPLLHFPPFVSHMHTHRHTHVCMYVHAYTHINIKHKAKI